MRSGLRVLLPDDYRRYKDLEESVVIRVQGSCCPRRICHESIRSANECLPVRSSERLRAGRSDRSEWRLRNGFEKDKWSNGWFGRPPNGFHRAKTQHLQVNCSALGRTRTCGLLIRSKAFRASVKSRRVPSRRILLRGGAISSRRIPAYTHP